MIEINLRPALLEDVDSILAFWDAFAENHARPLDSEEALHTLLGRDPGAVLLAYDATTLVGTVIAGWDGWRASIYRLAVRPEWRGRGVARKLVDRAIDRCRELGANRIGAVVLDDNELGVATWAALGFSRQDQWSRWIKDL